MKSFKEFRMPPMTMGRDNTIVGVRDHDITGSDAHNEMLKKAAAKIKKKFTFKKPKFKVKTPAKLKAMMEKEPVQREGKYLKYSDLLLKKHRVFDVLDKTSDKTKIKLLQTSLKAINKEIKKEMKKLGIKEGKITWKRGELTDGTMQIGIFDKDKEKALEAARQLIIFLRKNKRTKIGGDKEDSDGQPNEAIAKYSEELSKLVFDDELLDDLEPNGSNADQTANDIVFNRLRDLGVNIR